MRPFPHCRQQHLHFGSAKGVHDLTSHRHLLKPQPSQEQCLRRHEEAWVHPHSLAQRAADLQPHKQTVEVHRADASMLSSASSKRHLGAPNIGSV